MDMKYLIAVLAALVILPGPVHAYYGGDLKVTYELSQVCPCDIISSEEVSVELTNYGTKPDTFYLSVDVPEGWSGFVLPEVTLASGESQVLDPSWINPPCGTEPGKYTVKFRAESSMSGKIAEEEAEIEVMKCHAVEINADDFGTCQGSEVASVIEIVNAGNLKETFSLSVSPDWVKPEKDKVTIGEMGEETVKITAKPPKDLYGPQNVTIMAVSHATYAKTEKMIRLDIDRCHLFSAAMLPPEENVCMGDTAEYHLHIDNKGTGTDKYMLVTPAWADVSENNVSVGSGQRKTVTLEVQPPSAGEKKMIIYVSSLKYPTEIVAVEGVISVKDCRDASVSITPEKGSVCRGDTATYTLKVNNTGNMPTTYDVLVSIGSGNNTMNQSIILKPHEIQSLTLDIDSAGYLGKYPVRVGAYVDNRSVGSKEASLIVVDCYNASMQTAKLEGDICRGDVLLYEVVVENRGEKDDSYVLSYPGGKEEFDVSSGEKRKVETEIDVDYPWESANSLPFVLESEGGVRIERTVTLNVTDQKTCYSLEMSPAEDGGNNVTVAKGYGVPVKIKVKNTGIRPDNYEISVGGPEWAYASADSFYAKAGDEGHFYIYLSPPFEAGEGEYRVRVLAGSENTVSGIDINARVVKEPVNVTAAVTAGDASMTGLFLFAPLLSFEAMVLSSMTILTALVVVMRFIVFK